MNSKLPTDFRDYTQLHRQLCQERGVSAAVIEEWESLNDELEVKAGSKPYAPYLPPWAYDFFGGYLRETPCFPNQPGFYPEPVSDEDLAELTALLLPNEKRPPIRGQTAT